MHLFNKKVLSWKKYEMLNPNSPSMSNVGNLTSEASIGQNDPAAELIENAQSLGRFSRNNLIESTIPKIKSIKNQLQLETCII